MKAMLGTIPSYVATQLLKGLSPSEKRGQLVDLVNNYPNWFRRVDKKFLTETKFGFKIWCDRWDIIGQTIMRTGQWEGLLSRTILALLRPGDFAIDIGANIGYDTMLMSQAVSDNGTVLAFEPDLENLASLIRNIQDFSLHNVIVQSAALADSNSFLISPEAQPT